MNKLSTDNFLRFTAVVLLVYCLALLLLPGYIMRLLGITYSSTGALFMQFLGASLGGHAWLNWRASAHEGRLLVPVYEMNIVALSLAVAISLVTLLNRSYTLPVLAILGMHLAFLFGFIFGFKKLR